MINQDIINDLKDELHISEETLTKLAQGDIELDPDVFDIKSCVNKQIPYEDTLGLIQYVHEMNSYSAQVMYDVIVNGRKSIKLISEVEKKKTVKNTN